MFFLCVYKYNYRAGIANFKSPHFTYNLKSIFYYCHSLMNKKAGNFKQNSQLKSLQKKPQSMRQFE